MSNLTGSEFVKELCNKHKVEMPVLLKAKATVERILGNLATSNLVYDFGQDVLSHDKGLAAYKWDMAIDIAKGMK